MNKHRAGQIAYGFDGPLGDTVLVVSTNPGESNGLVLAIKILAEFLGSENPIIGEEGGDLDPKLPGLTFDDSFAHEGVVGTKGKLVVREDFT